MNTVQKNKKIKCLKFKVKVNFLPQILHMYFYQIEDVELIYEHEQNSNLLEPYFTRKWNN